MSRTGEGILPSMTRNLVDLRKVRRQFSGSADSYNRHAGVQRAVVERLTAFLAESGPPGGPVLEVGTGTGLLSQRLQDLWPEARPLLSDLAHDMTRLARRRLGLAAVDADCRSLPFIPGHFVLVCSSSVYQWLDDLVPAFAESARVLRRGGRFAFALFGAGTLGELHDAYRFAAHRENREVRHLHTFPDSDHVKKALEIAGFDRVELHLEDHVEYHAEVADLLRSLKGIGAGNANPLRPRGLASRRIMHGMMDCYRERFGDEKGVPATYRVIYGIGTRQGQGQGRGKQVSGFRFQVSGLEL
jgi:malonyl-CoA O-methyltransferase